MASRSRHWLWVCIGITGIGIGTVRSVWGMTNTTKHSVDVALLETGGKPPGRYVELSGGHVVEGFHADKRVGIAWDHWVMYGTSRERARVLLHVEARRWPLAPGQDRFSGIYGSDMIPTELIVPLVQAGRHTEQFEVLSVGDTPSSTTNQGLGFVGIGAAMLLWHGWRLGWFRKQDS